MDIKFLLLYFLLGGLVVSLVTYFGSQEKGLLAAFVANLPAITIVTLSTIYFSSGAAAAISYFKGILLLLPAWLVYAVAVLYLLPRFGLALSLSVGISLYIIGALVTMRLVNQV